MSEAPGATSRPPSRRGGRRVRLVHRDGVEVAAERELRAAGDRAAVHAARRASPSPGAPRGSARRARPRAASQSARSCADGRGRSRRAPPRALASASPSGHQTWTSKSRSAWLSETFLSVDGLRRPMMSAQGIWKVARGVLLRARAGDHHAARRDAALVRRPPAAPVTSMIGVDAVMTTFAPSTASSSTSDALDDDAAAADEAAVLDDVRARSGRLEHAADAHAAGEVHVRADLRAASRPSPRCRPSSPRRRARRCSRSRA